MQKIGILKKLNLHFFGFVRNLSKSYEQGQSFVNTSGKTVREYFYEIDHQGQVNFN